MKLSELIPLIEGYTVICLTHTDMREDWYRNERLIPEHTVEQSYVIGIGAIHPEQNEFPKDEPALRIYLED